MPGRQAKTLTSRELNRAKACVRRRPTARRDLVILLLSVRAGLRACEIAALDWSMVLDAGGRVAWLLELHDVAAKMRFGRRIPVHPELHAALVALRFDDQRLGGAVVRSRRGGRMQANSIVNL